MKINYKDIRLLYYLGILCLVLYGMPEVIFIKDNLYPVFNFTIVEGLPIISVIALLTGFGAFMAYKFRKIG